MRIARFMALAVFVSPLTFMPTVKNFPS